MGRIHTGPGHSTVGEEENEVVLTSVTQSRAQAHCATILIGSAILGSSGVEPREWPGEQGRSDWDLEVWYWISPQKATECSVPRDCLLRTGNSASQGSPLRARRKETFLRRPVSHWPGPWWVRGMVYAYRRASERGDTLKTVHFLTWSPPFSFCLQRCSPSLPTFVLLLHGGGGALLNLEPDPFVWSDSTSFYLFIFSLLSCLFVIDFLVLSYFG